MQKIYELIERIRQNDEDDDAVEELEKTIKEIIAPVVKNGRREIFIIESDNFDFEDSFITGNRYEEIFLYELVDYIVDVDGYTRPTEVYVKILEYMVNNNISSYKQDW